MIIIAYIVWLVLLSWTFIFTVKSSGNGDSFDRYSPFLLPLNALLIIYLVFSCIHDTIRRSPAASAQPLHYLSDDPSSVILPRLGTPARRVLSALDSVDLFLHRTRLGSALLWVFSTAWLVLLCVPPLTAVGVAFTWGGLELWLLVLAIAVPFASLMFWVGRKWVNAAKVIVKGPPRAVLSIQDQSVVFGDVVDERLPAYEDSNRGNL